jgi:hypothetical protein
MASNHWVLDTSASQCIFEGSSMNVANKSVGTRIIALPMRPQPANLNDGNKSSSDGIGMLCDKFH